MSRVIRALIVAVLLVQAVAPLSANAQVPPAEDAVTAAYVDNVVVPTHTLLSQRLGALKTAISALKQAPTPANLEAARDAWKSARQPWEWSESFLFGPVSSMAL